MLDVILSREAAATEKEAREAVTCGERPGTCRAVEEMTSNGMGGEN